MEDSMENYSRIDEAVLSSCGKGEQALYATTIGVVGVSEYLQQQIVALSGHFVFTAGGHGDVYINFRDLFTAIQIRPIAMQMAYECRKENIEAIVGTPYGADILATLIAHYWTIFTEKNLDILKLVKDGDAYAWYKDHGIRAIGKKIMQVEDVINSSKSVRDTADFILQSNGILYGVIAGCNRLSVKNPGLEALVNKYQLQFAQALLEIEAVNYEMDATRDPRDQCPLCKMGMPIDLRVGHSKKFLEQIRNSYPDLYKQLA